MVRVFGYFYVLLAVGISTSTAIEKTWLQNNNWASNTNWNLQRLPCSNDIVKISKEDVSVFMNINSTLKQLILPKSGSLVFGDSVELAFSDGKSSKTCKGDEIQFTGSSSNDWFDPRNWGTSKNTYHPWQTPCQYDIVKFPEHSSYKVVINKNVIVSQVFIGDKELNETEFQKYITINTGIHQITLAPSVSFQITGKKCTDKTGCFCGSDKPKEYICKILSPCPERQCTQKVKPSGGCCSICGTVMLLHVSSDFDKTSMEQEIKKMLNKFVGVTFTSVKIEERLIQVVLEDRSSEDSKVAAHSLRETLLTDTTSNILKIEILPKEQSAASNKRSDELKNGLSIGIPVFVIVVISVIILGAFLVKRKKTRARLQVNNENCGTIKIDDNEGSRVNPLYDSTMEMENIGFNNASSVPENDESNEVASRENPLYETSKN